MNVAKKSFYFLFAAIKTRIAVVAAAKQAGHQNFACDDDFNERRSRNDDNDYGQKFV